MDDNLDVEKDILEHYGVKGMRWGVRRNRRSSSSSGRGGSVRTAPKFSTMSELKSKSADLLIGDPNYSLARTKGRKNFKKNVKSDVNSITNSKAFKLLIFNKETSLFAKAGRDRFRTMVANNAKKRYEKALEKENNKRAAHEQRKKATLKLIDNLMKEDRETSEFFGQKYNEVEARKFWEATFSKELEDYPI